MLVCVPFPKATWLVKHLSCIGGVLGKATERSLFLVSWHVRCHCGPESNQTIKSSGVFCFSCEEELLHESWRFLKRRPGLHTQRRNESRNEKKKRLLFLHSHTNNHSEVIDQIWPLHDHNSTHYFGSPPTSVSCRSAGNIMRVGGMLILYIWTFVSSRQTVPNSLVSSEDCERLKLDTEQRLSAGCNDDCRDLGRRSGERALARAPALHCSFSARNIEAVFFFFFFQNALVAWLVTN